MSKNQTLPRGVERRHNRFRARIWIENRQINIGTYDTPEEAHEAYKSRHEAWHGS